MVQKYAIIFTFLLFQINWDFLPKYCTKENLPIYLFYKNKIMYQIVPIKISQNPSSGIE